MKYNVQLTEKQEFTRVNIVPHESIFSKPRITAGTDDQEVKFCVSTGNLTLLPLRQYIILAFLSKSSRTTFD